MSQNENKSTNNYYKILTLPNFITTFRILASIGLCTYITMNGIPNPLLMSLLTVGVGATDALDGFLSRKCGMASQLGGILDPIADKVYNWGIGITLMATGIMPLWPLLIAVRDLSVFSVSSYQFKKNNIEMKPTMPAKLKMFFQSVGVISTLAFGFGTSGLSLIAPTSMILAMMTILPEVYCIRKKYFNNKKKNQINEEKEPTTDKEDKKEEKTKDKELFNNYQKAYQVSKNYNYSHNLINENKPKVLKKTIYKSNV